MNKRTKKFLGWIAFSFVVIHTTALAIYGGPPQLISEDVKNFVKPYADPLFRQNWSMFAPVPVIDGHVKAKLNFENDSTDWYYPFENDVYWHKFFRGSHHGEMAILESHYVFWLSVDLTSMDLNLDNRLEGKDLKKFRSLKSYRLYARFAQSLAKKSKETVISVEFACELENVKSGEEGTFYIPEINVKKWN